MSRRAVPTSSRLLYRLKRTDAWHLRCGLVAPAVKRNNRAGAPLDHCAFAGSVFEPFTRKRATDDHRATATIKRGALRSEEPRPFGEQSLLQGIDSLAQ
jgi:hypothetical protein